MADPTLNNMALDVVLPEPQTMQKHLTSANPHPQYITYTSLVDAVTNFVELGDLMDVEIDSSIMLMHKALIHDGTKWVPTAVTAVMDEATNVTPGVVRLATDTDVANNVTNAVITPVVMKNYIADYVALTSATAATFGTVKVASTAAEIKTAIENNAIADLVEQVNPEMYVCCTGYDNGVLSKVIATEPTGNIAQIDRLDTIVYDVYSRGVLSGYVNTDDAMASINIHSGGIAYDTSTCGKVSCFQNADMKRVTVMMPADVSNDNDIRAATGENIWNRMATLIVAGDVRNVMCSATGHFISTYTLEGDPTPRDGYWEKCWVYVVSHGHLRNATIEGDAVLRCDNGVVENIIVRYSSNDYPRNYKMIVGPEGSAFNVALQGNHAYAAIQGYAENVCIYSDCQLDLQYSTAKVKNVTVYNGGRLSLTSGASVEGLVAYPGALIMPGEDGKIEGTAACHEPDKLIKLIDSVSNVFTTETVSGETFERTNVTFYSGTTSWNNMNDSDAYCFTSASITDTIGATTYPTRIADPAVMMYSIDTPRGLLRMDTDIIGSLNRGEVIAEDRGAAISSAYQYQEAKIMSCFRKTQVQPIEFYGTQFYISAPNGMYDDLTTNPDIQWRVVF